MGSNDPIQEIIDEMIEASGVILFRVTATWANNGRSGEGDSIVLARNAIEAINVRSTC